MQCARHSGRTAVGQCANCGAGVCNECADATASVRSDYGILCVDCLCDKYSGAIEFYKKDIKKRLTRIIVSAVLYFFGIFAIIFGFAGGEYVMGVVGIIFCGLYTGLTWRKAAQASHEEYERTHGVTYVVTDSGIERQDGFWLKLVYFLIGTVFGVIVTPFRIVIDILQIKKNNTAIKELKDGITSLQSI